MEIFKVSAIDAFQDNECYVLNKERAERILSPVPSISVLSVICRELSLPREMELLYTACFAKGKDTLSSIQSLLGKYKSWFFIADASWQPQSVVVRRKRLWRKLEEKWNLSGFNPIQEIENVSSDGIRYSGLAELNEDGVGFAFQLMREYPSTVIISQRKEIASRTDVNKIFTTAFPKKRGLPSGEIDWLELVLHLCPLNDIVVKVGGSFGERVVSVDFFMEAGRLEIIQQDGR